MVLLLLLLLKAQSMDKQIDRVQSVAGGDPGMFGWLNDGKLSDRFLLTRSCCALAANKLIHRSADQRTKYGDRARAKSGCSFVEQTDDRFNERSVKMMKMTVGV